MSELSSLLPFEKKKILRKELLHSRKKIHCQRRYEASLALFDFVSQQMPLNELCLSFMSLPDEISTSFVNHHLASASHLVLPKIDGLELGLYLVKDFSTQLIIGPYGIWEPIPEKCQQIPSSALHRAFIPGVAFDRHNHRMGYGKGYYDRFLADLKCPTVGLGFREQFVESLPIEPTDISLSHVFLF